MGEKDNIKKDEGMVGSPANIMLQLGKVPSAPASQLINNQDIVKTYEELSAEHSRMCLENYFNSQENKPVTDTKAISDELKQLAPAFWGEQTKKVQVKIANSNNPATPSAAPDSSPLHISKPK